MSDDRISFLGVPIDGDITYGHERAAQRPKEELAPLIRGLLTKDEVSAVRWTQYTPYFNDGEPCIFGATGVRVLCGRTFNPDGLGDEDDEATEYEDGFITTYDTYDYVQGVRTDNPAFSGFLPELTEVTKSIEAGEFDDVLLSEFGDHATVTVTPEKIYVEFYEHD